jgi:ribonuclease-3 family protein
VNPPLTKEAALKYSVHHLAFIGDSVHSLLLRLNVLKEGKSLQAMHLKTSYSVSASAQAISLDEIMTELDDEEKDIVRRGRNAHAKHQAPRSATTAEYSASTGFEALIGFHFLTGNMDRINFLLNLISTRQESKK